MIDERTNRAVELFQEAWMLLLNLNDLRGRLPEPNMPSTRKLPPDWNEFRSYGSASPRFEALSGQLS